MSDDIGDGVGEQLVSKMGSITAPYLSRTKRCGLRLNYEGFSYYRERVRRDVTYWRCSNKWCKGRLVQRAETVTRKKNHLHAPLHEAVKQSDIFVAFLSSSDRVEDIESIGQVEVNVTMATMPNSGSNDPQGGGMEFCPPIFVWQNPEEEQMEDVKPDIRELEESLTDTKTKETGVNTDADDLIVENTLLKMKIQRLEMEMQRYKDTMSRIRSDLDILNVV